MAFNILASGTSNLNTISNLALINPQKSVGYKKQVSPSQVGGNQIQSNTPAYLFDIEGENAFTLESEITDHYTESNSPIQDHIALRPELVTVQGFIAELSDILVVNDTRIAGVSFIQSKLVTLGAYVPEVTETSLVAINSAFLAYQAVISAQNTVQSISNAINGQPNTNKQGIFFGRFYQDWLDKTLFTIQTPWNIMQDMAIQSLRSTQDAETRVITNFEITFKKVRFVDSQTASSLTSKKQDSRNAAESQASENNGTNVLVQSAQPASSTYGRLVP